MGKIFTHKEAAEAWERQEKESQITIKEAPYPAGSKVARVSDAADNFISWVLAGLAIVGFAWFLGGEIIAMAKAIFGF